MVILVSIFLLNPLTYGHVNAADEKIPDEIYFLLQMENFLRTNYVNDIDDLELLRGAIKGMVESLNDPYSEYYTPSEFKEFLESTSGNFGGIGVVITLKDKYITVVSVLSGSPAEKAGIKPGDRIVEIDGSDITGLSTAEVTKRIKGDIGTKVNIGVIRDGETLRFEVERDIIKINPVESTVLGKGIGYIKINEFNENTVENLDNTLDAFKKSGVLGIVLDLRNNPGGYLDQAVEVAKRFVPKGPIVNIVSKDGKTQSYTSDSEPSPFSLVVLVNGGSASASEILAGAIKDRKAGYLVGERTFGKGMVQRTLSLGALGGIKLTTAYYTTPNGTNINKTGIIPDVVVEADKSNPMKDFIPISTEKTLSYGNIGLEVLGVQQRLKFLNLLNAQPDGVFGPRTLEAVKTLQKQAGLPVTGIVDSNFYKALNDAIIKKLSSKEDIQLRKAIDILEEMLKNKHAA
ncbi:MAG TPA: S41 family peptidase [Thermoanaerobacterales bacterium]|nr:S41 family peptidase [Tepidanaerobacter sp. GT38]HHY42506.1 S41 family peptidase [Thermoanaerobacterales bacterium]